MASSVMRAPKRTLATIVNVRFAIQLGHFMPFMFATLTLGMKRDP